MKTKRAKSGKEQRLAAARKAKRAAVKGDGTFADRLVVTREADKGEGDKAKHRLVGHNEDLTTLHRDGQVIAVYKLVRVSTLIVKRKIALNRG